MSRPAPDSGPTAVYRLWDAQGILLYIGLSHSPQARYVQHEGDKLWWPAVQRRQETWYDTRKEAEFAERAAIGNEAPLYNRTDESGANCPPHGGLTAGTRVESSHAILSALEADLHAGRFHRHRLLPTPVELGRRYGHAARDVFAALDELQRKGLVRRVSSNRYVPTTQGRSSEETARGLMLQEIIEGIAREPFTRKDIRILTGRSAFVVDRYVTDLVAEGRLKLVGRRIPEGGGRAAAHYVVPAAELPDAAAHRRQGVILYGPPAAGKDTVTLALVQLVESRYGQFARLKVGSGKSAGYRMGTAEQLRELEVAGDVIYANSRYGNTYVIDRLGLDDAFGAGVPVVHLGQVDGICALVEGYTADWALVLLWCSREETARRSAGRGDSDTEARVAAWQATREDLDAHPDLRWDLTVDTETTAPEESARLIDQLVVRRAGAASA